MNYVRAIHLPNINQQIIIRVRKLNFNEILYGSIFQSMNNSSYQDVSFNKFRFY